MCHLIFTVCIFTVCTRISAVILQQYELTEDADGRPLLSFNIPRDANDGIVNNRKELFKFR